MSDYEILIKYQALSEEMKKKVIRFMDSLTAKPQLPIKKRTAGLAKGKIKIKSGFDDPIEDFADYS